MQDIEELKRQGLSIRAISRLTGWDRKTISKYLKRPQGVPVYGPRAAPASKLDPFKPYLGERLQAGVWNAVVLLRELRERSYTGGYTILTDWLRPQRRVDHLVFSQVLGSVDWAFVQSRGVPPVPKTSSQRWRRFGSGPR